VTAWWACKQFLKAQEFRLVRDPKRCAAHRAVSNLFVEFSSTLAAEKCTASDAHTSKCFTHEQIIWIFEANRTGKFRRRPAELSARAAAHSKRLVTQSQNATP
jgi:hypothetical protein